MRKKWIISRHTRNIKLLINVLLLITNKKLDSKKKTLLLEELKNTNTYNPRFNSLKLATLESKINQLCFYMFGYKKGKGKNSQFLLSPLGREFINNYYQEKNRQKIFLSMLWGLQFTHPHSKTDSDFHLFPFRLIYMLLSEKRLDKKLYDSEIISLVMFEKETTKKRYEELVYEILKFRSKGDKYISDYFLKYKNSDLVNALYEWSYYTTYILEVEKVLDIHKGNEIVSLPHGKSSSRKLCKSFITIPVNIEKFLNNLKKEHPFDEKPKTKYNLFTSEWVRSVYNFFPMTLVKEINIKQDKKLLGIKTLELPNLLNRYAENYKNDDKSENLFENILEKAFNLFINVEAEKISGPSNTDIECIFLVGREKFLVEAKSTRKKLISINSGRLKTHRKKHMGKYTIIITPRYSPAALTDIEDTENVLITSSIFSEYLYNHIVSTDMDLDYSDINNIIKNNMGTDISEQISEITLDKFGIK